VHLAGWAGATVATVSAVTAYYAASLFVKNAQ